MGLQEYGGFLRIHAELGKPGHRCDWETSVSLTQGLALVKQTSRWADQTGHLPQAFPGPKQGIGRWAGVHISFPKLACEVICSNFPGRKGVSEGTEGCQNCYTNEYPSARGREIGERRLGKPIDVK